MNDPAYMTHGEHLAWEGLADKEPPVPTPAPATCPKCSGTGMMDAPDPASGRTTGEWKTNCSNGCVGKWPPPAGDLAGMTVRELCDQYVNVDFPSDEAKVVAELTRRMTPTAEEVAAAKRLLRDIDYYFEVDGQPYNSTPDIELLARTTLERAGVK